jgi:imidazolonepropionase-like amidohydrolase
VATINGAHGLGMDQDLGSLEPGKLADLIVLDANPLEDIHNTNTIRYVMKNGRLYDGFTLDEVWPRQRPLPAPWWWGRDPKE